MHACVRKMYTLERGRKGERCLHLIVSSHMGTTATTTTTTTSTSRALQRIVYAKCAAKK